MDTYRNRYSPQNDNPWLADTPYAPTGQAAQQKILPKWVQTGNIGDPNQSMQIFAPGVSAAINAAAKPIPKGLSMQDMANMKARIASQNQISTRNALTNAAQSMGGAATPAFAMTAARLQAGGQANAAASMADVNIQETRNNQNLQMQRRGQMADAAKLGIGYGNTMANWWQAQQGNDLSAYNTNLQIAKLNAWKKRTNADMTQRPSDTPWGGIP